MPSTVNKAENYVSADLSEFSVFTVLPTAIPAEEPVGETIVYPNPCYVSIKKEIIFTNLPKDTTLKIYNAVGELVFEDVIADDSPTYPWKLKTKDNKDVASGVYVYVITKPGGTRIIDKIAIIR